VDRNKYKTKDMEKISLKQIKSVLRRLLAGDLFEDYGLTQVTDDINEKVFAQTGKRYKIGLNQLVQRSFKDDEFGYGVGGEYDAVVIDLRTGNKLGTVQFIVDVAPRDNETDFRDTFQTTITELKLH
jgi:hypothetical protein